MDRLHILPYPNLTEDTQLPTIDSIHPSFDPKSDIDIEDYLGRSPTYSSLEPVPVGCDGSTVHGCVEQYPPILGADESTSPKLDESVSENALTAMDGMDQPDWLTNNPSSLLNNQYGNGEDFESFWPDDFDFNSRNDSHGSTASAETVAHHTISAPALPSRPAMLSRPEPIAEPTAPDSTDAVVPVCCPKGQESAKQDKLIYNAATDKDPQTTNKPSCSKATSKQRKSVHIPLSTGRKPAKELKIEKAPVVRKRKPRQKKLLTAAQKKEKSLTEKRCRLNAINTAVDKTKARLNCKIKYTLRIWRRGQKENDSLKQENNRLRLDNHRLRLDNHRLRLDNHRLAQENDRLNNEKNSNCIDELLVPT